MERKDFYRETKNDTEIANNSEIIKKDETIRSTLIGVVCGCNRLHVRKEKSMKSESLCVLEAGTRVVVKNAADDTSSYYAVTLTDGTSGYCRKEFIQINQKE